MPPFLAGYGIHEYCNWYATLPSGLRHTRVL